ncbi:hypothetical protein [Candidatus Sororendozoicomonas aggregata]|uniref:hypothetical protein n=1 Tax=Candidatus Sororendozoicomonas aggregata TaxID=3073239 RepID=UPI002ED33053
MKKYTLYFSLPALILWAASNVYASSCQQDFNRIDRVTSHWGYMETNNHVVLSEVSGPVTYSGGKCRAWGREASFFQPRFALSWERGNWRATLIANY